MDSDTDDVVPWAPSPLTLTRFAFRASRPLFFFFFFTPTPSLHRWESVSRVSPNLSRASTRILGASWMLQCPCHLSTVCLVFSASSFFAPLFFSLPLLLSSSLTCPALLVHDGSLTPECTPLGLSSCRSRAPPCLNSPTGTALVRGGGGLRALEGQGPHSNSCVTRYLTVCVFACQTAIDRPRRASRSLDRQFAVACLPVLAVGTSSPDFCRSTPLLFPPIHVWSFASSWGLSRRPSPHPVLLAARERERGRESQIPHVREGHRCSRRRGRGRGCVYQAAGGGLGLACPWSPSPPAGLRVREPDDTCALRNRRSVCILLPAHRGLETYTYMMRPRPPCVGAGALSRPVRSCPPRAGSSTRGS